MRRPLLVLPLVLASALVLAGCAAEETNPEPAETDAASIGVCDAPEGDVASAVTVTGDFGAAPTVDFADGLEVGETERAVLVEGDEAEPGQLISAAYALYNATTGDLLENFGWVAGEPLTPFRADYDMLAEGFAKTIGCLGVGTRVVGVIPGAEGFGEAGEQLGISPDDVLLFVVDILSDNVWSTDLPEIGGTEEAPTVTLVGAPKTDLEIAVLEEGDGEVVGTTGPVTVHYHGTAWETGEVFDQNFDNPAPQPFPDVQGLVQGFTQALIGQKVGSRVLVTMPPALGYGGQEGHALQPYTLVFLIDILDAG